MRGRKFRSGFVVKGKGGSFSRNGAGYLPRPQKEDTKSSDVFTSTPCTVHDPNGTSVTYADEVFRVVYGSF